MVETAEINENAVIAKIAKVVEVAVIVDIADNAQTAEIGKVDTFAKLFETVEFAEVAETAEKPSLAIVPRLWADVGEIEKTVQFAPIAGPNKRARRD